MNRGPQGLRVLPGALCRPPLQRINKDEAEATSPSWAPTARGVSFQERRAESGTFRAPGLPSHPGPFGLISQNGNRRLRGRQASRAGLPANQSYGTSEQDPCLNPRGVCPYSQSLPSAPEASSPPHPVPGVGKKLESRVGMPGSTGPAQGSWEESGEPARPAWESQECVGWGTSGPADTHTPPRASVTSPDKGPTMSLPRAQLQ